MRSVTRYYGWLVAGACKRAGASGLRTRSAFEGNGAVKGCNLLVGKLPDAGWVESSAKRRWRSCNLRICTLRAR